jgi:hypothetical protein
MPQRDGISEFQPTHLGNLTIDGTTPVASAWLDTREMDKATLMVINNTVTDAGAAAGYSFVLQESATTAAADATTVDAKQTRSAIAAVTADGADNSIAGRIGYLGSKRYARLLVTGTAGSDADVTVIGIAGDLAREPQTGSGTAVAAT